MYPSLMGSYNPWGNLSVLGQGGLNPLETLTGETLSGMGGAGGSVLPYLGIADMLLNPPRGPQDATAIGSPTQSGKPIVTQTQSWGPSMVSGGLRGTMAGAPFGPPGMIIGALMGANQGKK